MAKSLTNAQYNFVCGLLAGKTREAAYAAAYPKSQKWARSVRETTACRLLKTESVWEYYTAERDRLRAELAESARRKGVWSREKSMEVLAFVVGLAVQDAKDGKRRRDENPDDASPVITPAIANSIIKGVCELNRMLDGESVSAPQVSSEPLQIIDDYREGD